MLSQKFICATYDYSTYDKAVAAPYMRKSFFVTSDTKKCTLTVGCAGLYDVFVNGKKITKGLLAPYISNPDDLVYYDEYDISALVSEGENVVGFQLGDGVQNCIGGLVWDIDKAKFRGSPRVAFALETTDNAGNENIIEADSSVKCAPSPVLFDDIRCGVVYDARKELSGWSAPGFDDSGWANALIAETPRGEAVICKADPILCSREIKPVSFKKGEMAKYKTGGANAEHVNAFASDELSGYLYDFGINTAGIVRLKIRGEAGQKIDLQFGEFIDGDGKLNFNSLSFFPSGYCQRDVYFLKGDGEETFEPQFTYHGFRYCLVIGITEAQATEALLTMEICSSDIKERGGFRCSDIIGTKLQAMTKNSTLSNFYYFPTDCPHREKNGWTGDAAASCEQTLLNFSAEKSYAEWLRNIRKAQRTDGALPGIVPTGGWGFHWGNGPAWDTVLTTLPFFIYKMRGDKSILLDNADSIFRYVAYISTHRTARGTVELGLGDWLPITVIKSPLEFTDSVVTLNTLKMASYIFSELGRTGQKEFTDTLYNEIRDAVRKYLVDFGTMTAIGNCQTSQALAICYDVFDESEKPEAFKRLLEAIKRADNHLDCGFIGLQVIFKTLAKFGEADLAYKLIARTDFPSFGYYASNGYTALPESFKRMGERPDSLNHHFFGMISAFFITEIGGIKVNPYLDDAHTVNIEPKFIASLTDSSAYHETVDGKVTVKWEKIGNGVKLTVGAPDTARGEIKLPNGYQFEDTQTAFRKLESGEFEIVNTDAVADNIIEF